MRILLLPILLGLILITSLSYADRVCIEKTTGKLIEYQSDNAPLGTLSKNAINSGYNASDIIEKYVTPQEWQLIKEEQIDKPIKEKAKQKEQKRQKAINKLKDLGLLEDEIDALFK